MRETPPDPFDNTRFELIMQRQRILLLAGLLGLPAIALAGPHVHIRSVPTDLSWAGSKTLSDGGSHGLLVSDGLPRNLSGSPGMPSASPHRITLTEDSDRFLGLCKRRQSPPESSLRPDSAGGIMAERGDLRPQQFALWHWCSGDWCFGHSRVTGPVVRESSCTCNAGPASRNVTIQYVLDSVCLESKQHRRRDRPELDAGRNASTFQSGPGVLLSKRLDSERQSEHVVRKRAQSLCFDNAIFLCVQVREL
jgi:hypothetical protein